MRIHCKTNLIAAGLLLAPFAWSATLQEQLNDAVKNTQPGKIPKNWKVQQGDWKVCLDTYWAPEGSPADRRSSLQTPKRAAQIHAPKGIGSELAGGSFSPDSTVDDFTLQYQMKYDKDRDYWNNLFQFRIPERGNGFYAVRLGRDGRITLFKGKTPAAVSTGVFAPTPNHWIHVKVEAKANRIQVFASSNGGDYASYIDYIDPDPGYPRKGKVAFGSCRRFRFRFMENPWENNPAVKALGSWIVRAEPSQEMRRLPVTDTNLYPIDVDYFVDNLAEAPRELRLKTPGENKTFPLSVTKRGYHRITIPFAISGKTEKVPVTLSLGKSSAKITVENRFLQKPEDSDVPGVNITDFTSPITKQTYVKLVDRFFEKHGYVKGRTSWEIRFGCCVAMYQATGDQKYLDAATEWVRKWLEGRRKNRPRFQHAHFASRTDLALTLELVLRKGNLSPEEQKLARALAEEEMLRSTQESIGMVNRGLGYALAITPFLRINPDHVLKPEILRYHEKMMYEFMQTREGMENSACYLPITAMFFVRWIDENNLQHMYQDPGIKNYFDLLLQLIDVSGGLPQFADYGGKRNYSARLAAVFERLAAVYKDGRFKWAASQIMRGYIAADKLDNDPDGMAWAAAFTDDSIKPVRPDFKSTLLSRNTGHLDKLFLRSSYEPGAFNVMVDMINGSEHGDNNSLAVINVINNGQASLIDKAGQNSSNHSKPLIRERSEGFPYQEQAWRHGRWYALSYDLKLFCSWGFFSGGIGSPTGTQFVAGEGFLPYEFTYNPAKEMLLGISFSGSGKVRISLDNVRLVKSSGDPKKPAKVRMLDDFEKDSYRWIGNFRQTDGGKDGGRCGTFLVDFAESAQIGKKFKFPLDIYAGEYDRVEFDLKIEPVAGTLHHWVVATIGDRSGAPRNYPINHNQNHPVKTMYMQDNTASTFAGFELKKNTEFGHAENTKREFLFARDKFLWVRDRLTPAAEVSYTAGPVWQLGNLTGVSGSNWIDSSVDSNLLVWLLPRPGAQIELVYNPMGGWKKLYPATFIQKASGTAGGKELFFDSILLPHDGKGDARKLADSIRVLHDDGRTTLIQVGEDWALFNPDGKTVSFQNLKTNHKQLFLERKNGKVVRTEAAGGTELKY